MRYALVNGEKTEATPKQHGICYGCGAEVFAKCGLSRVYHWAHKSECPYSSKEPKTEWHIRWQNFFPQKWQEIKCIDEQTKEFRIADIKTPHGLIVEFQHSHIDAEEREAREKFYRSMIWVVDETRIQRDIKKGKYLTNILLYIHRRACHGHHEIIEGCENIHGKNNQKIKTFSCYNLESFFPKEWLSCKVPVFFDYDGNDKQMRIPIIGIVTYKKKNYIVQLSKYEFISDIKNEFLFRDLIEALPPSPESFDTDKKN